MPVVGEVVQEKVPFVLEVAVCATFAAGSSDAVTPEDIAELQALLAAPAGVAKAFCGVAPPITAWRRAEAVA